MKIVYIITGLELGGAEVVTVNVANEMVNRGHKVILIFLTGRNIHVNSLSPKIQVIGLNMRKTSWGLFKTLFQVRDIIKKSEPDVVHSNMFHANVFSRLLRFICPIRRLICSEHNKNIGSKYRMLIYRYTDWLSDFNTNVSKEAVDYFIERKAFKNTNSCVMYNGIPFESYKKKDEVRNKIRSLYKISEYEFVFLNLGRLTDAKDHKNLLYAFTLLSSGKLLILGQGDLHDELYALINKLGLQERVTLAGVHSNVDEYYSAVDCFVLSSAWEGLPMVILEAMSFELPVITTNVGGAHETIKDEEWIVPPSDAGALADKMQKMICLSGQERDKIGNKNRQKASKFAIECICSQWESLYVRES